MPSVYDDTLLFSEEATKRFKQTFENGVNVDLITSSSNNQTDLQKIARLESENATLRSNM